VFPTEDGAYKDNEFVTGEFPTPLQGVSMRSFRLTALALALSLPTAALLFAPAARAQSVTSGDISGTLMDPSGAVIPGAKIVVANPGTGDKKTAVSGANGSFRVSLLSPGTYKVTVTATGFTTTTTSVVVSAGTVSEDDIKLAIGQGSTTVEVSAVADTVNTENADVVTTFTAEQVQALPNPGNDLTFVAQTAPGSVMNTGTSAGGYGNFSSFGISGLSNMFTLDGGYENDPFLNLNNTGASNLTLGNNEVDTVTVVSPAYSSQFGGLGGAQVNEITSSGTNHVHGNASYYWDGRVLNSNDYFNKQNESFYGQQNIPTFVNANQWAASLGGPIFRNKLFWFVNTEGIRAITPQNGDISVPNAAAQACTLGQDNAATGGTVVPYSQYIMNSYFGAGTFGSDLTEDQIATALTGAPYAGCGALNLSADTGAAAAYYDENEGGNAPTNNTAFVGGLGEGGIPFAPASATNLGLMQTIYGVYNNSPLRASTPIQNPNDPATNTYYAKNSALLTEWLLTARLDYKIGDKDNFYIHYKQDHGTQPTYTDLVDPRFTASSLQPAWEGQISEAHTFTPNLVNQLVLTGNYYSAPFENTNNYEPVAPFTFIPITGTLGYYGGEDYAFPQGRNVAGYQVIDDVSFTKGRNTIRFGYNIRRDNITDIQGVETVAPAAEGTEEGFIGGTVDYEFIEHFPVRPTQPVSVYDMGAYVEDAWKPSPKLTVTAGLRLERNSNPTCHTDCFSVLNGPVASLPTNTSNPAAANLPYNAAFGGFIDSGRKRAFTGYEKVGVMPRIAFNYALTPKTTIRGGFGMFTDTFPGLIADDALSNAPTQFKAAAYGYVSGRSGEAYDITPGASNSGNVVAADSALRFRQGYTTGATYAAIKAQVLADTGSPYATPSFITTAPNIKYPTYEEFSFAVEQRIDSKSTIAVTYVGNHGYHEPVSNAGVNLSSSHASPTYFGALPTASPLTPFATVTNVYSGASSNFNGVVASATRRSKSLTLQFNYEFAKALDEISNGGLEPFAPDAGDSAALTNPFDLHSNYGPADYNVKHNVTGSFVYELPTLFKSGGELVRSLVGGFEFSGDVFHQSGLPYSITQSTSAGGAGLPYSLAGGTALLLASQTSNNFDHHCGGSSHVILPNGVLSNPCNFTGAFATPTNFTGGQSRNSLTGPSYTNVDFGAFKTFGFAIPHVEGAKLKLGAQFFNLFNHTNFQNPAHGRGADNSGLGGISGTVGAPPSSLGSPGGADASPRLIQLHASLVF
jgi:hypothetical protein